MKMNLKKNIILGYVLGAILILTSIPVGLLSKSDGYSPFWALLPLSMGLFIVLYNRFNKSV